MSSEVQSGAAGSGKGDEKEKKLHIFVNRRRFDEEHGVKPIMSGQEIASLVGVPPDVAVVRRGKTGDSPEVGLDQSIELEKAEHFLVTRKVVEGGFEIPPRIRRELNQLAEGGLVAEYVATGRELVLYRSVPTSGASRGLPAESDVIVPVPSGYPASMIDLAGLPVGSPFLPLVKGGGNNQGIVEVDGRQWQLASYHPHNNGGGPPWDQTVHGFHTYFDQVLAWLTQLA